MKTIEKKQALPVDSTKDMIQKKAMELARERGFQKTSIRAICREANISIGAFYYYYKSKEDIVSEAFFQFDNKLNDETVIQQYENMPPLEALEHVLLQQTMFAVAQGWQLVTEYYLVLLRQKNRVAVHPDRPYYRAVYWHVQRAIEQGLLPQEKTVAEQAEFFLRLVRGCLVDWCLHDGSYDVLQSTAGALKHLLAGIIHNR